jgi:hypothetical protein
MSQGIHVPSPPQYGDSAAFAISFVIQNAGVSTTIGYGLGRMPAFGIVVVIPKGPFP